MLSRPSTVENRDGNLNVRKLAEMINISTVACVEMCRPFQKFYSSTLPTIDNADFLLKRRYQSHIGTPKSINRNFMDFLNVGKYIVFL